MVLSCWLFLESRFIPKNRHKQHSISFLLLVIFLTQLSIIVGWQTLDMLGIRLPKSQQKKLSKYAAGEILKDFAHCHFPPFFTLLHFCLSIFRFCSNTFGLLARPPRHFWDTPWGCRCTHTVYIIDEISRAYLTRLPYLNSKFKHISVFFSFFRFCSGSAAAPTRTTVATGLVAPVHTK